MCAFLRVIRDTKLKQRAVRSIDQNHTYFCIFENTVLLSDYILIILYFKFSVPGWLEAVRAFEILGILASAVALGLGILNLIKKDNYLVLRVAYICSFVAGILSIFHYII